MIWVLSLAVGIVLADSAIVTLALPQILRELDTSVGQVAWVLTAYNLVLGLAAVPAAKLSINARRAPTAGAIGLVIFAAASAGCALAPSLEVLIGARVVQALGGALVITACLELLVLSTGNARRGAALWATAGVAGAAIGPVVGGLLTEAVSWQSIFIVQVPLVLLALPAALHLRPRGAASAEAAAAFRPASGAAAPAAAHPASAAADAEAPTAIHPAHESAAADGPTAIYPAHARAAAEAPTAVHLPESTRNDRPRIAANLALALVSAALTAALFLLVLLLIEGWGRSPILTAITVTVIPLAAIASGSVARAAKAGTRGEAVAGSILIGGGLIALAFLPDANPAWTLAPQALIGLGLGLTVESLTAFALRDRFPRALQGGWTIASRHLGIVAGLALLTPIFTAGLTNAREPAQQAIAALVIDAPLPATTKLQLADGLGRQLESEGGRVPDLSPAFRSTTVAPSDRQQAAALETSLDDQLERAATQAFRNAFLIAGALALLAIIPALLLRDIDRSRDDLDEPSTPTGPVLA